MRAYPAILSEDDGWTVVTFRDLPTLRTWDETREGALELARDALALELARRIAEGEAVPPPSVPGPANVIVTVPPLVQMKLALASALRDQGLSRRELARRLSVAPVQVDRLLDPDHESRLPLVEAALAAVGKRIVLEIRDAA
jgi:antitoxin HicB